MEAIAQELTYRLQRIAPSLTNEFSFVILCMAGLAAIMIRLFAVVGHESVLLEYDPYFNYRTTQYLAAKGYNELRNWFDDRSWYPLGRPIGGTIHPGLMLTSTAIWNFLKLFRVSINLRSICILLGPCFSVLTVLATFLFAKELKDTKSALFAACLISIVPAYTAKSVAGAYDNEGIAIPIMTFTCFLWVKSVKTGSICYSTLCALSYFYLSSSWGGYVFILNLMALHIFVLLITDRFNRKHYIAWSTVYSLGTILSMQTPFIGFQAIHSAEHMIALGVFILSQMGILSIYLRSRMTIVQFDYLFREHFHKASVVLLIGFILAYFLRIISPWSNQFYCLIELGYAKLNIPTIASVIEFQPSTWALFYFDFHMLLFFFVVGLSFCFRDLTNHIIFLVVYCILSVHFAGAMVRLISILSPGMCIISGIGMSGILSAFAKNVDEQVAVTRRAKDKQRYDAYPFKNQVATAVFAIITVMCNTYVWHSTAVTREAYSNPKFVAQITSSSGRKTMDDFREAYDWIRHNTEEDAKIMSWWNYGYHLNVMGNRTVLVDNNIWNTTHISRVAQAFVSNETHAYEILEQLDVDYVLVMFGGFIDYPSDDINKFLWMVTIASSTPEGAHIKEKDYLENDVQFGVDDTATPAVTDSLLYKLSYHGFQKIQAEIGEPAGYDRVREVVINKKPIELQTMEEAYTSTYWLVRIYRRKKLHNRGL